MNIISIQAISEIYLVCAKLCNQVGSHVFRYLTLIFARFRRDILEYKPKNLCSLSLLVVCDIKMNMNVLQAKQQIHYTLSLYFNMRGVLTESSPYLERRVLSWLRHCTTRREVLSSFSGGSLEILK